MISQRAGCSTAGSLDIETVLIRARTAIYQSVERGLSVIVLRDVLKVADIERVSVARRDVRFFCNFDTFTVGSIGQIEQSRVNRNDLLLTGGIAAVGRNVDIFCQISTGDCRT